MARLCVVCWLCLVLSGVAGCGPSANEAAPPTALKVLVLPDRPQQQLRATYSSLLQYLSRKLDVPCELVIPDSYEHALELFHRREVQLARLGGMAFLKARSRDRAVPLVMRDSDLTFSSSFIARTSVPGDAIDAFHGRPFAFGPKLSTSGHLMPRHFLAQRNIVPEQFFSDVRYSDNHDMTAKWVRDGVVALGAVNSLIVNHMYRSGQLNRETVRIVWETPTYPDYVWVVQASLTGTFRTRLREAFLELSADEPAGAAVLEALQAKAYLPAIDSDFAPLEQVAAASGVLR